MLKLNITKPSLYRRFLCYINRTLHPDRDHDKFIFGVDPVPEWFTTEIERGNIDVTFEMRHPGDGYCFIRNNGNTIRCNEYDTLLMSSKGIIRVVHSNLAYSAGKGKRI